ncbi:MAG TPA: hypothetical protein VKA31_00370 [Mariprofundaceae bacterium]|nr:hypothetical protein [Mariprofundaceae bacterium]HKJ61908.1 hypothetical protein [Hyphomicrobiales bacterium]
MAMKVKEMPSAALLEDGTYVELEFKGEDGDRVTLGFSPERLNSFVSRAIQLTHQARIQKAASAGHLEVQPLPAVAAMAQEAVGGSAVIVGFRTDNSQTYHFSLSIDEADELRNQLVGASARAKKQAKQTRQ